MSKYSLSELLDSFRNYLTSACPSFGCQPRSSRALPLLTEVSHYSQPAPLILIFFCPQSTGEASLEKALTEEGGRLDHLTSTCEMMLTGFLMTTFPTQKQADPKLAKELAKSEEHFTLCERSLAEASTTAASARGAELIEVLHSLVLSFAEFLTRWSLSFRPFISLKTNQNISIKSNQIKSKRESERQPPLLSPRRSHQYSKQLI